MTPFEDCFALALEMALDDETPEELLPDAVTAQAALMAGFPPDASPGYLAD